MNRRRALAVLAGLSALPLLAACPGGTSTADEPEQESDQPDCDLGDILEGDKDCDPKPASSKPVESKKPKPRRTKRP